MSESRRPRLDTPRDTRRQIVRRPAVDADAFGVFAESFARYMGTAKFILWMTMFVIVWVAWNLLAPPDLRFDEPPSTLVAAALDDSMDPLRPDASMDEVAAHLATYNLVAAPVVDDEGRLLGAVTVDDLLDHMLPEGWRDRAPRPGRINGGPSAGRAR